MYGLSKLAFLALFATVVFAEPVRAQDDVILPDDAIDATVILDEPGTSQKLLPLAALSFVADVVVESSITAPSDGYVLAFFSGLFVDIRPAGPPNNKVQYGLSPNCDSPSIADVQLRIIEYRMATTDNESEYRESIATQQVYPVSAGLHTFCLVAQLTDDVDPLPEFRELTLSLLFIPTAYGTVETN